MIIRIDRNKFAALVLFMFATLLNMVLFVSLEPPRIVMVLFTGGTIMMIVSYIALTWRRDEKG